MFSEHTFLLPLSFYYSDNFIKEIYDYLGSSKVWTRINNPRYVKNMMDDTYVLRDYNVANYFYYFVLDTVYGFNEPYLNKKANIKDALMFKYKHIINQQNAVFRINVDDNVVYNLEVLDVALNIYSLSTGILSITLANNSYSNYKDVDRINQFARKIRVPNFNVPDVASKSMSDLLIGVKGNKVAQSMSILIENEIVVKEDYTSVLDRTYLGISSIWKYLLGDGIGPMGQYGNNKPKFCVYPIQKEDMFTFCSYQNKDYIIQYQDLTTRSEFIADNRLLFNHKRHTLDEQVHKGALQLLSPNSFLHITDSFNNDTLVKTKAVNREIVTLVLLQRAIVYKFQNRFALFGFKTFNKGNKKSFNLDTAYRDYMIFLSKIYYQEITFNIYGQSLYAKLQLYNNMDKQVNDLKQYFAELLSYEKLKNDERTNRMLTFLAVIAGVLTFPTFLTGVFGMNYGLPENLLNAMCVWGLIGASFVITLVAVIAVLYRRK